MWGGETDQGETADQDHTDDERLEVLVFNEDEVDVTPVEPGATDARPVERFPERTGRRTTLRTTLVRVLDVDDRHLVDLRLRLQTATFLRVGRRVHVVVIVVVVVIVEGGTFEIAESERRWRRLTGAVLATDAEFIIPHPFIHVDLIAWPSDVIRVLTAAVSL